MTIQNRVETAVTKIESSSDIAEKFADASAITEFNTPKGLVKPIGLLQKEADAAIARITHFKEETWVAGQEYTEKKIYFVHNGIAYNPVVIPYTAGLVDIQTDIDAGLFTVLQGLTADILGIKSHQVPTSGQAVLSFKELESAKSSDLDLGQKIRIGSYDYEVVEFGIDDQGSFHLMDNNYYLRLIVNQFGVSVNAFGAVGDGTTVDTGAIARCLAFCKANQIRAFFGGRSYKIDAALDPSGVEILGVPQGYNNRLGTRIVGSGNHSGFVQLDNSSASLQYRMKNIQIINVVWGVEMGYSLGCVLESVSVNDSEYGFKIDGLGGVGPLSNVLFKCRADVSKTALKVGGVNFANANKFDTCFFRGDIDSAILDVVGGLGAVNNLFINTEIAGENNGITLGLTKGTVFNNCYFECVGPNIIIDGYSIGTSLNDCTFGTLNNNNAEGIPSFIWHKSGSAEITVNGGYIYLPDNVENEDLSLIQSDAPSSLTFNMPVRPNREISARGWSIFGSGMPNGKGEVSHSEKYDPDWITAGASPDVGNGLLKGRYTQAGETITATIELSIGSTTIVGTNQWLFGLPFDANGSSKFVGSGIIRKSGEGFYPCVCIVNEGSNYLTLYATSGGATVSNVEPVTWAEGDRLNMTISYNI